MSGATGTRAPSARVGATLRLPRVTAAYDPAPVNNAMELLERADASNLKAGSTPVVAAVILISRPGQIAWQLTVDDAGALSVSLVPPGGLVRP